MIDWTKLTNDPVNNNIRSKVLQYLKSIRQMLKALLQFKIRHCFAEIFASPEIYTTIYVYELQANKEKIHV
jgi:hypothetical protein